MFVSADIHPSLGVVQTHLERPCFRIPTSGPSPDWRGSQFFREDDSGALLIFGRLKLLVGVASLSTEIWGMSPILGDGLCWLTFLYFSLLSLNIKHLVWPNIQFVNISSPSNLTRRF